MKIVVNNGWRFLRSFSCIKFRIWKGPLVDQSGKELLAKDQVADDKFLRGINFFVKGVEGQVPGSR